MYSHIHGANHHQSNLTAAEQAAAQMALTPVPNFVNQRITYDSGAYAGRTIRVELIEIQKADLGRKFARRDRRPLDPPNVAEAVFWEVEYLANGQTKEVMLKAEEVDVDCLMCHVDVFPVVGNQAPSTSSPTYPGGPVQYHLAIPPLEESKQTIELWGATFSHAVRLARCQQAPYSRNSEDPNAVYFPFPDLSVQSEGLFFFRYRVFDIKSLTKSSHCRGIGPLELPIMAEAYGGLCTVYSTKEFPGLKASTSLTKHLSLHGIKVNLRETERRRNKPSTRGAVSSPTSGGGNDDMDHED